MHTCAQGSSSSEKERKREGGAVRKRKPPPSRSQIDKLLTEGSICRKAYKAALFLSHISRRIPFLIGAPRCAQASFEEKLDSPWRSSFSACRDDQDALWVTACWKRIESQFSPRAIRLVRKCVEEWPEGYNMSLLDRTILLGCVKEII